MVKSYRKYEYATSFGVIVSPTSNIIWTDDQTSSSAGRKTGAGRAYVAANEDVLCWDVKKAELLSRWRDPQCTAQVTSIAQCASQKELFAIGHSDGSIRLWDDLSGTIVVTFNGHRSAITHLVFDDAGLRLASGSKDTDIILWNLLTENADFRLRGHKDQITGLAFLQAGLTDPGAEGPDTAPDASLNWGSTEERWLISSSKDALLKVWDISAQYCVETHVAQTNGECWALGISPDGRVCITAGNDGEMKVWTLDTGRLSNSDDQNGQTQKIQILHETGILMRHSKERTTTVEFHDNGQYVAFHGSEKAVEVVRIRSPEEVRKALMRKRKRRKEKAGADGVSIVEEESLGHAEVSDVFVRHAIIRTAGKVRSAVWSRRDDKKQVAILTAIANNQLEMINIEGKGKKGSKSEIKEDAEYTTAFSVDSAGHRTDIRALAISSDDRMLASASAGLLKIWNVKTQSCLRTLECGQSLCCAFVPGDKIVVIGTKTGELELYDIASSTLIDKVQAHDGAVWTLQVHPDGRSIVTGGADKSAKFWKFDIVQEEIPGTKRTKPQLKLKPTRVLKVADDILSVCFSPDARLLALSTLDNTVKVFFVDSLKLFLTLYGHKLPVLSISISSDSKLIATSSADKNVRIWGLDFGDCHKAFFAHQDSIMQVLFIPHPVEADERHIFFSASKDAAVKTWDGDKFEQIQKLSAHHGEVWAMVVSRTGEKIITASHDKSIRIWSLGDDLIFLDEERERELEQNYEATLAAQMDKDLLVDGDGAEQGNEVAVASKQTISTLTYGERIMEALDISSTDRAAVLEWRKQKEQQESIGPPQRNPLFMALGGISAERHVLSTISKIPSSALNDALMILPFSTLPTLFEFLAVFFQQRMQPDLAWRVFYFLLQAHNTQLVASKQLKKVMDDILQAYRSWTSDEKRLYGFNAAALTVMVREAREGEVKGFEDLDGERERLARGRKKRTFAAVT